MQHKKGIEVLQSCSQGARSALVCSYIINPLALKQALGKNFPLANLLLFSGEKTVDLDNSIKTKQFLDGSSIPLLGHVFHSKLYLFEHNNEDRTKLDLVISSFNATSAGLKQNLEFWIKSEAEVNLSEFNAQNLIEIITDPTIDIDTIPWKEFCIEGQRQLVVSPALEVLWRLLQNGNGLAPGTPRCIPDLVFSEKRFHNYDSILVHTLGNNSLSRAMEKMIQETAKTSSSIILRVISPYHNMKGLEFLHDLCIRVIGKKNISIKIEVLTVFPPDFPTKFGDPKKQPFVSIEEITALNSVDKRIKYYLKLWRKDTNLLINEMDEELEDSNVQNVFVHAKGILVKSENNCQCLIGSPNMTGAAFGKGPDLNFETAVWERRSDVANQLWEAIDKLFRNSLEVAVSDYKILKTWKKYFDSRQYKTETTITGSRDTLEKYLQFFINKDSQIFPLSVYEESTIYYDELNSTQLLISKRSGAPKINDWAKIYFIPTNLEKTTNIQSKFVTEELNADILLDRSKPDTILVRVDIDSNLLEEYKVTLSKKGNQLGVSSNYIPNWNPNNERAMLLVETQDGPIEIACKRKGETIYIKNPSNDIITQKALLRIYSKDFMHSNSFGYFKIRYRKRAPKFKVKMVCVNPFPFSIYFEELSHPLSAKILPDSISISVSKKTDEEIATIPIAVRTISGAPIVKSFLMCFQDPNNVKVHEVNIELRFQDDHQGYYSYVLPSQNLGYLKESKDEINVFVPNNLANDVVLVSTSVKNKLIPTSIEENFHCFKIPSGSFICDVDENRLWILEDFITPFHFAIGNQQMDYFPERNMIVERAPIKLVASRFDIHESLKKMCWKVVLRWWVRRWGYRGRGKDKECNLEFPLQFEILPSEIQNIRQAFDSSNEPFEGYLDFKLIYKMNGGYDLESRRETVKIIKTEKFVETLEGQIWSLLKHKETLVSSLSRLFHSQIIKKIPLNIFLGVIRDDPDSRLILMNKYNYSPVISRGSPEFHVEPEKCTKLLETTFELIFESVYETFATNPKLPKIPKGILRQLVKKKLQKSINSLLVRKVSEERFTISPNRLFEKIDRNWILFHLT